CDAAPFGLITTHVPLDVANQITERDIEATPMLVLLEARGFAPTWARQSLGALPADRGTARALSVEVGAPLVRLERVVYGAADRPIEHLLALYRADRYEYRTILRRGAGDQPGFR
ncbi:MAG: UTRA domain-containing protein, partial [Burkholderiales bacterium]